MSNPNSRIEKLRQRERIKAYGKISKYPEYEKSGAAIKKPSVIKADIALGKNVSITDDYIYYKLAAIIICTITTGVLATLASVEYGGTENNSKSIRILLDYIGPISWTVLVIFVFLIFDAPRLLNILLVLTIVILAGVGYNQINREREKDTIENDRKKKKTVESLLIATMAVAAVTAGILAYYAVMGRGNQELLALRTQENIRKQDENIQKLIKQASNKAREDYEQEYRDRNYKQQEIADKAMDLFLSQRIKPEPRQKRKPYEGQQTDEMQN